MATVKGVMRSYGAAVRNIEREQQRQAREAAKRFKEQQKIQEIQNAEQAVKDWTHYVEMLQSVHKTCTESINWNQIKNTPEPKEPNRELINENKAQNKIINFKPSIFDKIFGSTQKKIDRLKEQLAQAKKKDDEEYELKYNQYLKELNNWGELHEIATGIDNKDTEAYKNALQYFNPFAEIGELGTQISFDFENNHIDINIHVNSEDVIPNYELKQTSTGKLSKKNMTQSKFNELYQDHICSSVIRVAREVFAYLPLEYARINAMSKILNSTTGHLEKQPILSVILLPETIENLNLDTIDPSDSMQNFVHNMKFNKTKGFSSVEKVELNK
ncbi:MAG: hypothetical protein KAT68_12840 [Bacteroidales bacterium]|nr:hypothetical protein [Bacteroidales bacterium]